VQPSQTLSTGTCSKLTKKQQTGEQIQLPGDRWAGARRCGRRRRPSCRGRRRPRTPRTPAAPGTGPWPDPIHPAVQEPNRNQHTHTRIVGKGIDRSVHGGLEQGAVMISRPRNPPCSLRRAGALSWRPWPISRASTACRRDVREFAELEVWALEASAEVREQRQRYVPLESHPEKRTPGSRLVSSHCFNIFFQLFYLFFFSFSSEFLKFILYKICPRNFFNRYLCFSRTCQ
jgi:hypothetical protein